MAVIKLYEHDDYYGRELIITENCASLNHQHHFHDILSSVKVESGKWLLFKHDNYNGEVWEVSAGGGIARDGKYRQAAMWGGCNDCVSSILLLDGDDREATIAKAKADLSENV